MALQNNNLHKQKPFQLLSEKDFDITIENGFVWCAHYELVQGMETKKFKITDFYKIVYKKWVLAFESSMLNKLNALIP